MFDCLPNEKRNFSARELDMGSGNPDVTTEEPITIIEPLGNIWFISNVVIIQAVSSGKKKRSTFDPKTEFASVETSVIVLLIISQKIFFKFIIEKVLTIFIIWVLKN